jgi:hypothetical protein
MLMSLLDMWYYRGSEDGRLCMLILQCVLVV